MAAGLRRPKLPGTLGNHGPWALVFYKVYARLFAYCSFLSHGEQKVSGIMMMFHLLAFADTCIHYVFYWTYDI